MSRCFDAFETDFVTITRSHVEEFCNYNNNMSNDAIENENNSNNSNSNKQNNTTTVEQTTATQQLTTSSNIAIPTNVSSASSLDTFLMDLPGEGDLLGTTTNHQEGAAGGDASENNNDHQFMDAATTFTIEEESSYPTTEAVDESSPAYPLSLSALSSSAIVDNSIQQLPQPHMTLSSSSTSSAPNNNQNTTAASASAAALTSTQQNRLDTIASSAALPPATTNMAVSNSIPEFLYQLTKMLTDDNSDIIEWSNGRIEVHSPYKLESHVLKRYFRHSKFASFQRQLNYFGFRKLAGKGKMAPCSYVNEAAGDDISSLLLIKRKPGPAPNPNKDASGKKRRDSSASRSSSKASSRATAAAVAPHTAVSNPKRASSQRGKSHSFPVLPAAVATSSRPRPAESSASSSTTAGSGHLALARQAVGRGIRHSFEANTLLPKALPNAPAANTTEAPEVTETDAAVATAQQIATSICLSQLADNYKNSLNNRNDGDDTAAATAAATADSQDGDAEPTPLFEMQNTDDPAFSGGFLSRNSSLIDLAMLAPVDEDNQDFVMTDSNNDYVNNDTTADQHFGFVDFPNPEIDPNVQRSSKSNDNDNTDS